MFSKKCKICENKTKSKKGICDECYSDIVFSTHNLIEEKQYITEKLDQDYPRITPYVRKVQRLLDIMKTLYLYSTYLPKEIKLKPLTFEEFKTELIKELTIYIDTKIATYRHIIHDTGDLEFITELKIFKDEVTMLRKKYPDLKEALDLEQINNILVNCVRW